MTLLLGSWVTAPITGATVTTTDLWPMPITSTVVFNATTESIYSSYIRNVPVSDSGYDNGFEWGMLTSECASLLGPHCNPVATGPTPTSTTFPESCMPSSIMGL